MSTRRAVIVALAVAAAGASPALFADAKSEVEAATAQWIGAFNRRSLADIVKLYAPDAVFLGTSSPVIRDTPALVEDYFKSLATLGPDARNAVTDHRVQVYGDIAINSGYYTLTRTVDGRVTRSPARFSFVYQKRDGRWLIVSHHSSALPAAPARQ